MKPNLKNIKGLTYSMDDKSILQLEPIRQFLYHLPYYALLLDSNRRIVASNYQILNDNDLHDVKELFEKGPGDIFQCENAREAGCGNSPNCRFCGIFKTLTECIEKNGLVTNPCKIMVSKDSFVKAYEFAARCSSINISGITYYFLTLTDVSSENRKRSLEKIFFHDVLNLVNGLKGISMFIQETSEPEEMCEYFSMLSNIVERLNEIISTQRDFVNAEKRELIIQTRKVSAKEIIDTVLQNSIFNGFMVAKDIQLNLNNGEVLFNTDPTLLIRVLINMVKNAFEAKSFSPVITLGCYNSKDKIAFFVHNHAYIEEQAAKCIFQPMFSTKSPDRGLGTYSMRLIGENYLKGKVWFNTNRNNGTTFTIELPINENFKQ